MGNVGLVFGFDSNEALKTRADELPSEAYSFLERPPRYMVETAPRQQPERVKQQIVKEGGVQDDPCPGGEDRRIRESP